ncbi:MAG: hypothetical protein QNJ38_01325 [Prochloraceae cyanobacterium]|nr:hypothetical protein [Prochloraceae cyanobacterium]
MTRHNFIEPPLSLFFRYDRTIEDLKNHLCNWVGLTLDRGYAIDSNDDFYESRLFAMHFKIEKKKFYNSDGLFVCCSILLGSGDLDLKSVQICTIYLLFEIAYRRLGITSAFITKNYNVKIADYLVIDKIPYDRVSNKTVSCPEHFLDLYARAI